MKKDYLLFLMIKFTSLTDIVLKKELIFRAPLWKMVRSIVPGIIIVLI